jgi:hypothetical protein
LNTTAAPALRSDALAAPVPELLLDPTAKNVLAQRVRRLTDAIAKGEGADSLLDGSRWRTRRRRT